MPSNIGLISPPAIEIIETFPNPAARYDEGLWYEQHDKNIVIIDCFATDVRFGEHWSPLSIKCAFGGKELYHFGNKIFAVSDSNFLIVNEGAVYSSSISSETPVESFTLNFTKENICEVFGSLNCRALDHLDNPFDNNAQAGPFVEKLYQHNEALGNILLKIRRHVNKKEFSGEDMLELLYATLEQMILLYNHTNLEIENCSAVHRSTKEERYKRLHIARDYMDSCFSENISLHALSQICYMNPHYLLREFKSQFKITPHQYLTNCRLKEAHALLKHSGRPVMEVANMVGFDDATSFSKLFKKYSGYSPQKFRSNSSA